MDSSSTDPEASIPTPPGDVAVLINHEEQYAIWPAGKPVPTNWRSTGMTGTKDECLAHIRNIWTDMRPLSVRERHRTP